MMSRNPDRPELMFSYGSNMSAEQMRRRAPSARLIAAGRMPGYELCFPRKGTWRDGGVAGYRVCTGEELHGIVYAISEQDLAAMDSYEHPSAYRRVAHDVVARHGVIFRCAVYEAYPDLPVPPAAEYLGLIIDAAERFEFPNSYVQRLRSFATYPTHGVQPATTTRAPTAS